MGGVETGGQDSSFGGEDCSAKYCALHHDTLDICNTPCLSFLHIPAVHLPFTDAIWNGHTDCQISISLSNELQMFPIHNHIILDLTDVSTSRLHEVSRHRRFINFGVMGSYLHVNTEHPGPSRQLSSNGLQEQCRF